MPLPEFRLAITKEPATSMAWSAKVFSGSTLTVWPMDWSNIIRKREASATDQSPVFVGRFCETPVASDTDALQPAYRFADIVERHIARQSGSANSRCDNESDFST